MDTLQELARTHPYWSLEEFAMVANQWLPRVLPEARANTRVREEVNPRLIRQYTTWGLVDAPYKEGREARYTYRHLLQLLVTRRLLAEGYATAVIAKLMAGQDDASLEAMLAGGAPMTMATESAPNPAVAFLQNLTGRSRAASAPAPAPSASSFAKKKAAPMRKEVEREAFLDAAYDLAEEAESADYAKLSAPAPAAPAPPPAPAPAARPALAPRPTPAPFRWLRIDIAPGLELNLREDFRFPADPLERQTLLEHLARQIDAATQG